MYDTWLDSKIKKDGLLNDDEYKNIKQKLLSEKALVYQRFTDVDKEWEAWTDLSIKTMNFAGTAQERWLHGSVQDKKAIMTVIGSYLVLNDKKLTIEPKTPFLMIEKALQSGSNSYDEGNLGSPSFLQTVLGSLVGDCRTSPFHSNVDYYKEAVSNESFISTLSIYHC